MSPSPWPSRRAARELLAVAGTADGAQATCGRLQPAQRCPSPPGPLLPFVPEFACRCCPSQTMWCHFWCLSERPCTVCHPFRARFPALTQWFALHTHRSRGLVVLSALLSTRFLIYPDDCTVFTSSPKLAEKGIFLLMA